VLAAVLVTVPLSACASSKPVSEPTGVAAATPNSGGTAADAAAGASPAPGSCHVRPGPLPDRSCTPGVINPAVTPDTLATTVCKSGWTATVRPPASYTNRLKRAQIAAYGYQDTNMSHYEEDHLISLELGGSPTDPRNLWPESPASPNPKDKVENALHRALCAHKITLAAAQQAIATDWTTALRVTGAGG
jgi:hypothetical protein